MINRLKRIIVRKLFETGFMRIDYGSEEDFDRFLDWIHPYKHKKKKENN